MKTLVIAYVTTLVAFGAIDVAWLTRMADTIYRPVMGDMVVANFRAAPAVAFYLIYAGGLVYFAVRPALAAGDWSTALINGALLGFIAYATYDLTNQATLKNWSTQLTLTDLAWGTFLSGAASLIGYLLTSMFGR